MLTDLLMKTTKDKKKSESNSSIYIYSYESYIISATGADQILEKLAELEESGEIDCKKIH